MPDLLLQEISGAPDQHPGGLQGLDQPEDAADILDGGRANALIGLGADQGADAIPGEQLSQQRAIVAIADEVDALDAALHGMEQSLQQPALRDIGLIQPTLQGMVGALPDQLAVGTQDRKSTRLNS